MRRSCIAAWRLTKGLCFLAGTLTLLTVACFQGVLLYHLSVDGEWVVPQWMVQRTVASATDGLEVDGHRLEVGNLSFRRGGEFRVGHLALHRLDAAGPLVRFGGLTGKVSLSRTDWVSTKLLLTGGEVLSGENRVLREVEIEITAGRGVATTLIARGQHRLAKVSASGYIIKDTVIRRDRLSISDMLVALHQGVKAFEESTIYLVGADQGHLQVSLDNRQMPSAKPLIRLHFQADQVRGLYGSIHQAEIQLWNEVLAARRSESLDRWYVSGSLREIRLPAWGVRLEEIQLGGEWINRVEKAWSLRLDVGQLWHGLQNFYETALDLTKTPSSLAGEAVAVSLLTRLNENTFFRLESRVEDFSRSLQVQVRGTVEPTWLMQHPLLLPFLEHERIPQVEFGSNLNLFGNAILDTRGKLESADFVFQTLNVQIDEVGIGYLEGRVFTDGVTLALEDLYLERDDLYGWASGRFALDSQEYAVSLKGRVDPVEVGPLVGNWWETIFDPFDFSKQGDSWADFVIRGNAVRNRPDYFFGEVRAENVSYYGMPLESGRLRVRGSPWFVELFDFEARVLGDQALEGYLAWEIDPFVAGGPRTHWIQLDGSIESEALAALLKSAGIVEAARWVGSFELTRPANVWFDGRFHSSLIAYPGDFSSFVLEVDTDSPLRFEGIPMDHLSFEFHYRHGWQRLREGKLGIAKGVMQLEFDRVVSGVEFSGVGERDAAAQIHFLAQITDACRADATNILEDYLARGRGSNSDQVDATSELTVIRPETAAGRFDLELEASGSEGAIETMVGSGSFRLIDNDLGRVPVLGPISRILEGTPLGFTSLRLDTLDADFLLGSGYLEFPALRLTGPTAIVDARGTYRLEGGMLNMRVRVRPVGQVVETPSLLRRVGSVLLPLPGILEGDITGTLDAPQWRSAYDPRSWLGPVE